MIAISLSPASHWSGHLFGGVLHSSVHFGGVSNINRHHPMSLTCSDLFLKGRCNH